MQGKLAEVVKQPGGERGSGIHLCSHGWSLRDAFGEDRRRDAVTPEGRAIEPALPIPRVIAAEHFKHLHRQARGPDSVEAHEHHSLIDRIHLQGAAALTARRTCATLWRRGTDRRK